MAQTEAKKPTPTWMDHHQLNFWLWAFLRNGQAYLESSQKDCAAFENRFSEEAPTISREQVELARRECELTKYHFVVTMGSLIRVLDKARHQFPSIQAPYSRASNLREGRSLRGLIEHADEYFSGRGKHRDQWEHHDTARGIITDASCTEINKDGHWLGGRFNVERAIAEVEVIAEEARKT